MLIRYAILIMAREEDILIAVNKNAATQKLTIRIFMLPTFNKSLTAYCCGEQVTLNIRCYMYNLNATITSDAICIY